MAKKHSILLMAVALTLLTACTSIDVHPVAKNLHLDEICIVNNPLVIIPDFLPVLQKRFQYHGIDTHLIEAADIAQCSYYLEYSAKRSWDFTPYLSWAEIKMYNEGRMIADAEYKLIGKGGLSLTKWQSVEEKMNPVVDSLLGK